MSRNKTMSAAAQHCQVRLDLLSIDARQHKRAESRLHVQLQQCVQEVRRMGIEVKLPPPSSSSENAPGAFMCSLPTRLRGNAQC